MVRNICVLGGSSHPQLTETICSHLGIPPAKRFLGKFAVGETRVEIGESVRGKDVFIIQSGSGKVNDNLVELLITISACKIASANRVTAILPFFPYSRQNDVPHSGGSKHGTPTKNKEKEGGKELINGTKEQENIGNGIKKLDLNGNGHSLPNGTSSKSSEVSGPSAASKGSSESKEPSKEKSTDSKKDSLASLPPFEPQPGYRQWVAQSGKLVADLLTCAGADHVITMDLHDAQYQGFFDIPVDNLYGRHLLKKYIQYSIPNYQQAVIVSPDAGGAKRATAIADALGMPFALIHKERRATQFSERQNSTMMLVGDVANRTAILIDDMADTAKTITRAANLVKREGATKVYGLVTHGLLSGDAIDRIKNSALDKLVVTNSVDQAEHKEALGDKLDVLEVGFVFAEAIRRVHHGESISVLFSY